MGEGRRRSGGGRGERGGRGGEAAAARREVDEEVGSRAGVGTGRPYLGHLFARPISSFWSKETTSGGGNDKRNEKVEQCHRHPFMSTWQSPWCAIVATVNGFNGALESSRTSSQTKSNHQEFKVSI